MGGTSCQSWWISCKRHLAPFRDGCSGSVAVELAFIAPLLALLLIGAVELGRVADLRSTLATAAKAGVVVAVQSGKVSGNQSKIETVARSAAGNGQGLSVQVSETCKCPSGVPVACTAQCSGAAPWHYAAITLAQPHDQGALVPLWTQPPVISASMSMRLP